jgi:hypothetical protein
VQWFVKPTSEVCYVGVIYANVRKTTITKNKVRKTVCVDNARKVGNDRAIRERTARYDRNAPWQNEISESERRR